MGPRSAACPIRGRRGVHSGPLHLTLIALAISVCLPRAALPLFLDASDLDPKRGTLSASGSKPRARAMDELYVVLSPAVIRLDRWTRTVTPV